MNALKNLPENPAMLAELIDVHPGQVVSMSLSRNDAIRMTLFAFDGGEGVSEEAYDSDTFYYMLEGSMTLVREGLSHIMPAGSVAAVPAGVPHAIGGDAPFKLLQVNLTL